MKTDYFWLLCPRFYKQLNSFFSPTFHSFPLLVIHRLEEKFFCFLKVAISFSALKSVANDLDLLEKLKLRKYYPLIYGQSCSQKLDQLSTNSGFMYMSTDFQQDHKAFSHTYTKVFFRNVLGLVCFVNLFGSVKLWQRAWLI